MIEDTDTPATQADKLRSAARIRADYLLWLAKYLSPLKWDALTTTARADIRKAVADELKLLAEGM